jgi:hypothetical protein
MAFWFGVTSMIRSASVESCGSIAQTPSSRTLLPAVSSSPSSASQWQTHQHRPRPRLLSQTYANHQQQGQEQRHQHRLSNNPLPLLYSYLTPRYPFSFLPYSRYRQRTGDPSLRSGPIQILRFQAPASSPCFYCLTGTGLRWAPDDNHGYDDEMVGFREQIRTCRWREWD